MKTEDFERLKKLCDENGFELVTESPKENDKFFVVKLKDRWKDVDFALSVRNTKTCKSGRIYKIDEDLRYDIEAIEEHTTAFFRPSTEQAYVEQLKKEAFERFGEIKEGDRFKDLDGYGFTISKTDFTYFKNEDSLYINGWIIYSKGKWAERVKERVKVEFINHYACANTDFHSHVFDLSICRNAYQFDPEKAGKFLAEQLEKYLNNEI